MNTRIISTILVFFFPIFCFAQMEFVETVPLYPTLPFNLKETIKNNFKLVSVVHDVYQKSEGDESGFTWSNQISSYQYARYIIKDKTLFNASFYDTENDKISSNEYHYIDGLISAIEFSSYDSLQEGKVKYAFHYAYRDSLPYQKVLMFNDDKSFRLHYDYLHEEGKLLRLKVTAHGVPKKENSIKLAEDEMTLLLVAHSGDAKTERYYKNMHELLKSERIQYNEKGFPINKKIRDGDNKLLMDIIYIYEDETLVKEKHTKYENKSPVSEKLIFYVYESNGLLSKIIAEEGDTQRIVNLLYQEEY